MRSASRCLSLSEVLALTRRPLAAESLAMRGSNARAEGGYTAR